MAGTTQKAVAPWEVLWFLDEASGLNLNGFGGLFTNDNLRDQVHSIFVRAPEEAN